MDHQETQLELDLSTTTTPGNTKVEFLHQPGIYFVALGGAEEVGFNMYAYIVNGRIIVVDCGYGFLNDDFPGIELGLADASFLENYQDCIEGLFITHSHEDHFGAIAHVWPRLKCPVYGTAFALGHIMDRLKEYKLDEEVECHTVKDGDVIKVADFSVEYAYLVHSTPETSALIIRTPYGNIVHATDWRFDDEKMDILPTNWKAFKKVAKEGVALYVGDSTNMTHLTAEPSEMEIRQSLIDLVPKFKNTLVATCFASNIMRMESLIMAADKAGRTPVISGRSLNQNMRLAKECGYLQNCPPYAESIDAKDILLDKMLYICAGSQGNYRSGLSRIVNGENKDIQLGKGDAIIFSSKIIPGNEEKIERMQEKLRDAGVDVITSEEYLVHTSGHGGKEEIKKMYSLLKPKLVIPVHGDKRNIREQKRFATECGVKDVLIARNGEVVLIENNHAAIVAEVPTDILGVDRRNLTNLSSPLIKNRKRIAYNCSLFISVVLGEDWQVEDLQISSNDILEEKAFADLASRIKEEMIPLIPEEAARLNYRQAQIEEFIRSRIRKLIFKETDIKPVTTLHFYKRGMISTTDSGEESENL